MERLRSHHISLFQDLAQEYLGKYGVPPWESKPINPEAFAKEYADDQMNGEKRIQLFAMFSTQNIFSQNQEEDREFADFYRMYYADVIGVTDLSKDITTTKRIKVYLDFLLASQIARKTRIVLSEDRDAYCETCVVGKHCAIKVPIENNTDLFYEKTVREYMQSDAGRKFV